jgi:hypothetical protein
LARGSESTLRKIKFWIFFLQKNKK